MSKKPRVAFPEEDARQLAPQAVNPFVESEDEFLARARVHYRAVLAHMIRFVAEHPDDSAAGRYWSRRLLSHVKTNQRA